MHVAATSVLSRVPQGQPRCHGGYGLLFDYRAPWEFPGRPVDLPNVVDAAAAIGDTLYEGFQSTPHSADNPSIPAGYTYFGQFVDHDLTFDAFSLLRRRVAPVPPATNLRTPRFDLDCLYGRGGREGSPHLYLQSNSDFVLIGSNEAGELDLPRNIDSSRDAFEAHPTERYRTALIGDPRNDENVIVSQLHLAFLRFHNRWVGKEGASFEEARRQTRWHYQWIVLHDFLPKLCGQALVSRILQNPREPQLSIIDFRRGAFIPREFSMAAYRVGHTMVRPRYELNDALTRTREGRGHHILDQISPKDHLGGGRILPPGWTVQWDRFVATRDSVPQPSRRMDDRLTARLRRLPIDEPDRRYRSLAFRTLLRGWAERLPSGQEVARKIAARGVPVDVRPGDEPLWLYVLREAFDQEKGRRLGQVGSQIVAEVVIGLLFAGAESFVNHTKPNWKPDLAKGGNFELADLLEWAEMPISSQEWQRRIP